VAPPGKLKEIFTGKLKEILTSGVKNSDTCGAVTLYKYLGFFFKICRKMENIDHIVSPSTTTPQRKRTASNSSQESNISYLEESSLQELERLTFKVYRFFALSN